MSKPVKQAVKNLISGGFIASGLADEVEAIIERALADARRALTVELLARSLRDALDGDGWGDVDPNLFHEVLEPDEDSDHAEDAASLRETLQRAVDDLNRSDT